MYTPKIRKTPRFLRTRAILQQTAKDLMNKKLVPHHTLANFMDPNAIDIATHNYIREPIKEYTCPKCMLTIRCPRQWIREHHKMCEKTHPYFEKKKAKVLSRLSANRQAGKEALLP